MKQISDVQIQQIEKALIDANIPVQMFIGIQNLFRELPLVKEVEKKKAEVVDGGK